VNVCLVCNQYPPLTHGGHGSRTNVLARCLVERGHRVTVVGVVPHNTGITRDIDETLDGVRVLRLAPPSRRWRYRPGSLLGRWRLSRAIRKLHRRERFDLVDCVDSEGWMVFGGPRDIPLTVRFAATWKLYAHLGQVPPNPFIHDLEARTLAQGTHFYAPSRWAADETLKLFGYHDTPAEVIPNAVDTDRFAPAPEVEPEPGLVVYAGGIEPRKGIRELMVSMNTWGRTHPHSRLLLIGNDPWPRDERGRTFTEHCVEMLEPDLRPRVNFAGRLDRVTGLLPQLHRAEVCVYPSHIETFGIATVEGMAVGKPVINSSAGPGPELIEDNVSGLLCDPKNPRDIAEKIQRVLDHPDEARELGRRARERVLERFNHKTWAEKYEAFFQRCIADFAARGKKRIGWP
jgi:glycosyltransferase involved in cell wall biosynthesis